MITDQRGTTGRGPGEGRSPLPGQHDEAAAESSAGRSTSTRDPHERSSDGQGAGTTSPAGAASSPRSRDQGGDRRGARRQARGHRVTVRLDDEEEIGRAHVWTPVTWPSRMTSSVCKQKNVNLNSITSDIRA